MKNDGPAYDCSGPGLALPLALRRAAGAPELAGTPEVASCESCGVRYFTRPAGSPLAENGHCRACAVGTKPAAVLPMRPRRRRSVA